MLRAHFDSFPKPPGGDSGDSPNRSGRAIFIFLAIFLGGCAANTHQQGQSNSQSGTPGSARASRSPCNQRWKVRNKGPS
jgi:hypothetical protein